MRPPFFSLDGLDGAGKSTQCRLLADWLRQKGWMVVTCSDPGGTQLGAVLRDLLLHQQFPLSVNTEALLFMASRAQLTAEVIRPALEAQQAVVSDRFLLANIAYQGYGGGLDPDLLWQVGMLSSDGLLPDLTIVLDIPVDVAMSRRHPTRPDRLESRDRDYHERVRNGFLAEARRRPDSIRVVDARLDPATVHSYIIEEVEKIL
ncbi:MAG: hypothetical protein KatS3mg105_0399 [Gemmatales bacterium]|nr:MAG: hypothetical protein KatS3mg105_0399 [Gemmatales bacterium]